MSEQIQYLYKIMTNDEWREFEQSQKTFGSERDIKDGYVHLSTNRQVERIAKKYYATMKDGHLLKIQHAKVSKDIQWGTNSQGELFPHLYAALKLEDVLEDIPCDVQSFDFTALKK